MSREDRREPEIQQEESEHRSEEAEKTEIDYIEETTVEGTTAEGATVEETAAEAVTAEDADAPSDAGAEAPETVQEDDAEDADPEDEEEDAAEDADPEDEEEDAAEDADPEDEEEDDPEESEPGEKVRRRRGRRRKKQKKAGAGKKACIIAGSILGVLVLLYLGTAAFFMSHFLVNTTINGRDFSGKTVEDVKEYLKEQVADYRLTLREKDGAEDVITGAEISLVYKDNSEVEAALERQNQLLWIASLFSPSSEELTVGVEFDRAALDEKIQTIQAVTAEQTEPVNAHPEFDGDSYVVAPEEYGSAVDMEILTAKVREYITDFRPQLDLTEEKCYQLPEYTSDSPEVQEACDALNKYIAASITYPMDEDIVVDKELISTWLSCDGNMKVTFDEDAVREWMREFGSRYDTYKKTRTITSPTGEKTEVSGGTYGWIVDEDTETKNLIKSIKNGDVEKRDPAYKQTAASHSAQDWGKTYIEVDISEQHMWYIVDGSVAMETDVVTGRPDGDRDTPTGVYSILYKERDSTLKGDIDPDTGEPSYETPVAYWMPFTWQGHGFHDATWQSSFGGSRYEVSGSHGCVNMPYDKAGQLFEMISDGTPVIVHK